MFNITRKKIKTIFIFTLLFVLLYVFGIFHLFLERNFYTDFHYPYDGDIEVFVQKLKNNITPDVAPINTYNFYYYKIAGNKCQHVQNLRLVFLIKSSPENYERRMAIRSSWGFERRFSDVEIRTVFLIGTRNSAVLQKTVNEESQKYSDIVQANYTDVYFNNTYKTMSGFHWAMKYCPNSKFYMFVDDDYYISTKNVLRFIRYPSDYPNYLKNPKSNQAMFQMRRPKNTFDADLDEGRLYSGYSLRTAPHRHLTSTWYVPLTEYPYHMWPPYVSGGAYILSRSALIDMYYSSFYVKKFRFDDIYIAILAYKTKIAPFHCDEFHFYAKPYTKFGYEYVIASHGFGNAKELLTAWNEQKALGNA